MNGHVLLIAGPTAVGKTEVALQLAERLNGEIISVDSMQVYRGLDIGTAKPIPEDLARVPHHLIDILEPTESFDAAQFIRRATDATREIANRGHLPIFCGGTGLYFKAWLEGIGQSPPPDASLRAELQQLPLDALLAELRHRDRETFERIDRNNPRRIIRAVEVIRLTGKKFSEQRTRLMPPPARFFVLQRDRAELHSRIDLRVESMFARGLVDETRRMPKSSAARQALGYRQALEYLEGKHSLDEAIALVQLRTRQYAKRQLTWFRHQSRAEWIDADKAIELISRVVLADAR
jgi:tRNA dimethylallyltransferase